MMKDWIPFFQALIWPVFIGILFFYFKDWVNTLLELVKNRVEAGSEITLGPKGVSLGAGPKLGPEDKEKKLLEKITSKSPGKAVTEDKELFSQLEKSLQLIHDATYSPKESKQRGDDFYRIRVKLVADTSALLNKVEKVVYYLHPTFDPPVQERKNRSNNFEIVFAAWGQFNIRANVYLKGNDKPLTLSRYLNF